ncbi:hypothetical protein SARC_00311 [Sphaeroforma arctica JP610]|uniref:SET domain-containing protein n=1 Tax=Sphaeroforma arctica JP610 TaxID=667725 RepID=A0A0L0GFK1_9EUKA|nr:hypothetical protein SARC_00311 [Sphaeroforma arctica JP610]KNC87611.1 hypothetical protein SARC_00311 [Sphaeroforma arctica JP610]|eukprot:XP_014161513.1 hypothetical protein SARC_00311 [Sphaeroforma arctica JP610]
MDVECTEKCVVERDFTTTGRGLATERDVIAGEVLLSVPVSKCWTVAAAKASEELKHLSDAQLSNQSLVSLHLLVERNKGGDSSRAAHISCLPKDFDLPIFWDKDELATLEGSPWHDISISVRADTCKQFEELSAIPQVEKILKAYTIDLDAYLWARSVLWSRMAEMTKPDGERIEILAPWFDLFNHSPDVPSGDCFKIEGENVVVRATKDYKEGEQAFISYGDLPNGILLLTHGFTLEDNEYNSLPFYLNISNLSENKSAALMLCAPDITDKREDPRLAQFEYITVPDETGGDFCAKHLLSAQIPLPDALLNMVKIERLTPAQLASILEQDGQRGLLAKLEADQSLADGNDILAYITLHKTYTDMISALDMPQTEDKNTSDTTQRRRAHTLAVKQSERKILQNGVQLCEERLMKHWNRQVSNMDQINRCGCDGCMAKGSPYVHTLLANQPQMDANQEATVNVLQTLMSASVSDALHVQTAHLIFMFVHELWSHPLARSVVLLEDACPSKVSAGCDRGLRPTDLILTECPEADIYIEKMRLWSSYLLAQLITTATVSLSDMNTMRMEMYNLRSQGLIIPTGSALDTVVNLVRDDDECDGVVAVGAAKCHVWSTQLALKDIPIVTVETLNELATYPKHALLLVNPDDAGKGMAGWSCVNKDPKRRLLLTVGEWADSTLGAYATGMPVHGQSFSNMSQQAVEKNYDMVHSARLAVWPVYMDRLSVWRHK